MRIRDRLVSSSSGSLAATARSALDINTSRGMNLIISINQNVAACVATGTNNGCRPNPDYANNSQYSSAADSSYHGHARLVRAAADAVGPLSRQLHTFEIHEQRRREFLQFADRPVRLVEGLGPIRRRSATPPGGQRRDQFPDEPRDDNLGAIGSRFSAGQLRSGPTRPCRSTSRQVLPRYKERPVGRSLMGNTSSGMQASGRRSSVWAFDSAGNSESATRSGLKDWSKDSTSQIMKTRSRGIRISERVPTRQILYQRSARLRPSVIQVVAIGFTASFLNQQRV